MIKRLANRVVAFLNKDPNLEGFLCDLRIAHNSPSDSIVFSTYEFGSTGYTATMIDRDDL